MSVRQVRLRHTHSFVAVANALAQDNRLSLRARGLFLYLYSLPDGWDTSTHAIGRQVPEGRDAVRTAVRELEEHGYLHRSQARDEQGRWLTEWRLGDVPATDFQARETDAAEPPPGPGNPSSVSQATKKEPSQRTTPPCSSVATQPQNPSGVTHVRAREQPPGTTLAAVPDPSPPATVTSRDRATRIPDPFPVTPEMIAWCDAEGIPRDQARRSTEAFVDHFRAQPGVKGRKLDWTATWRNWLRRDTEQHRQGRARYSGNARLDALSRGLALAEAAEAAGVPITPFTVGKAAP